MINKIEAEFLYPIGTTLKAKHETYNEITIIGLQAMAGAKGRIRRIYEYQKLTQAMGADADYIEEFFVPSELNKG